LKTTLKDLGIRVIVDGTVRGVNGQQVRANIVAVLQGECDIGWTRNTDGTFDFIADMPGVAIKHNQAQLIHSINQKYAIIDTPLPKGEGILHSSSALALPEFPQVEY
jgi:Protein of unknown function (DUF1257)